MTLGTVVHVQREMNSTMQYLSFVRNMGGGELCMDMEGYLVPIPSSSSLCVVPTFRSMLFHYPFITPLLHSLLFRHLYLVVTRILLIVPVLSCKFQPTPVIVVASLNSRLLANLVTMVGIFGVMWMELSQKEYFFPNHLENPLNCVDMKFSNSFLYCPYYGSPPFPPSSTPPCSPLSLTSLLQQVVSQPQIYCVTLIH